jgi:Protein of unknown function (DUF3570)
VERDKVTPFAHAKEASGNNSNSMEVTSNISFARPHWRFPLVLAFWLIITLPLRVRTEDRVDYRFENYQEQGGRMHVQTHGAYFGAELKPWISLNGNLILDSISGATPIGAPPLPGKSQVAKAKMEDRRYAGFVESSIKFGNHTFSPQVAYSEESDYKSLGIALSHAIEFNEKNTTLSWGASHTFDQVLDNSTPRVWHDKNATDLLLGVAQLLNASTILSANLTLGYSEGDLSDPYKGVLFDDFPYFGGPFTVWPEKRPAHKFRQVGFLSLQHYFEPVHGAAEVTYRLHHDDQGIIAHTASLQWNQKIGKHVILSPLARYHTQTAADYYGTHFPGDPSDPANYPTPEYYSADYRISALESFTYGLALSVRVHEHASLELAYKRYEMHGTDGVTAADQYPKANVITGGFTLWF